MTNFGDWFIQYAPKSLDDIYGQDIIVKALKKQFINLEFSKAYMFQGKFGSGKTAIAKILAAAIACKNTALQVDGSPCGNCPTCTAIFSETYDRDVLYLNGEQMSAAEVDSVLDKVFLTPAIRDNAKVLIIDETQGLSSQAIQKFLAETQNPRKGVFFIFTAMSKLAGKNPGALQSRCKVWKMKEPSPSDVYQYLGKICIKMGLKITPEFATEGLQFIAENSEGSYRKAIQMLQQCYEGEIFEVAKIKETFGLISEDDAAKVLVDISNGIKTKEVFDVIIGNDFQDKFLLLNKIVGDAATYKAFGYEFIEESEKWKWEQSAKISKGKHFNKLCDIFTNLSGKTYLKRGDFLIELSKLFWDEEMPKGLTVKETCENTKKALEILNEKKVVRRKSLN